ncbi:MULTISPECIES: DUF4400 domain-containing protein [Pseudomonas]|uniref:DUF4400 domain-containing protein n=1 Tax=Pseudomonas nitroreducens TaxID=46680 RepID=UPI001E5D89A5|nr:MULTISPECIES: DUF4400 domain-containing protein [Pseudomonas]MCE4072334.1 DUF4400 domain-containing protein [Pseudomonas nitritireducens]MCE4081800.1 DUF4400 domain-containing protein [Pseudomonas nitroreducens]
MESKTRDWYTFLLLDSGAKAMVADVFIGERNSRGTVNALEEKAGWWFSYLSERGEALQKIIYQVVYRVVLALFWLPFLAVVVVPGAYAGWMRWHAKRAGFSYTSPFVNNHAFDEHGTTTVELDLPAPLATTGGQYLPHSGDSDPAIAAHQQPAQEVLVPRFR